VVAEFRALANQPARPYRVRDGSRLAEPIARRRAARRCPNATDTPPASDCPPQSVRIPGRPHRGSRAPPAQSVATAQCLRRRARADGNANSLCCPLGGLLVGKAPNPSRGRHSEALRGRAPPEPPPCRVARVGSVAWVDWTITIDAGAGDQAPGLGDTASTSIAVSSARRERGALLPGSVASSADRTCPAAGLLAKP